MGVRDEFIDWKQSRHGPRGEVAYKATVRFDGYTSPGCWDELIDHGRARPGREAIVRFLEGLTVDQLQDRQEAADIAIRAMGITFTVYSEAGNIDRPWPYDVIPRVITTQEWDRISEGLVQRLTALNHFIDDIYNDGKIVKDGVFPGDLLSDSVNYRPQCEGARLAGGIWAHICGSDLVRDGDGTMYVLEDNLRVPSGVSYMLENRQVTKRVFADLFRDIDIHPVDSYPNKLYEMLAALSPRPGIVPTIAVLTPGVYNSAYFEHSYLAQQMGVHLVEGSDLFVDADDCVYVKTIEGLDRVDVIYRRIDDMWLDPEAFNPSSTLGVAGLMRAWHAGNVAIANAPGAGVADDKVVYAYVPDMIRYYLGEEPRIANVPTYVCLDPIQRSYVLDHLAELVVKPANESGGYGVFIGPRSTAAERDEVRRAVEADPRNFIAQPTLALSTAPTLCDGAVAPRHLDLRPFILSGPSPYVTQGGLTRVALREGSLIVNSSQGGGSKDTWIIDPTVLSNLPPAATGHP
jgi:uncharacterized circularly permuted ATP-grasp superfamily protein